MNAPLISVVLTARERQVLRCLMDGLSNKQIGRQLFLSEGTVKHYLHRLGDKAGLKRTSRLALAVWIVARPHLLTGDNAVTERAST